MLNLYSLWIISPAHFFIFLFTFCKISTLYILRKFLSWTKIVPTPSHSWSTSDLKSSKPALASGLVMGNDKKWVNGCFFRAESTKISILVLADKIPLRSLPRITRNKHINKFKKETIRVPACTSWNKLQENKSFACSTGSKQIASESQEQETHLTMNLWIVYKSSNRKYWMFSFIMPKILQRTGTLWF